MQRHKIVRKASIGVLLLLPLLAVGVALTIMLSWGHQGAQQAEANTPVALWTMDAKGLTQTGSTDPCDTNQAGPVVCNVPLDTGFTVSVFVKDIGKLSANLEQAAILWTTGIIGPGDPGSTKTAANAVLADCPKGIAATAAPFLGVAQSAGGTCVAFPPPYDPAQALAVRFEFDLNCGPVAGSETVTMQSNVPANTGTYIEDDTKGDVAANAGAITIICTPPDAQINISVVDASLQTQKVDGSCWLISAELPSGVSEPPTINKPVDVVSDNNAQAECDGIGPIKADLSDKNPAVGQIDITISGKNRVAFGDSWHVQQVKSDIKYNPDPTKFSCDTSQPKTGSSTAFGCDVVVKNTQVFGTLTVNFDFNDPVVGSSPLGPVIDPDVVCVNIATFLSGNLGDFCTTAPGSTIVTNLAAPDLVKVTFLGCPGALVDNDKLGSQPNPQQLALGHAAGGEKQIEANFSCRAGKVFNLKTPGAANLFLTNQAGKQKPNSADPAPTGYPPSSCRSGTDVALFTHALSSETTDTVPKSVIDPKTGEITNSTETQRVATFEMDVFVKPAQQDLVCLNIVPGDYWFLIGGVANPFTGDPATDRDIAQSLSDSLIPVAGDKPPLDLGAVTCFINDKNDGSEPTGAASIGCVFKGKALPAVNQTLPLAYILVKPDPDLYSLIKADQDNGVVVQVLNSGCNVGDNQGHPIDTSLCPDSDLTIRWLEGDVNADCVVDAIDQQLLAFRWGAHFGNQLFNQRYDLVDTSGGIAGAAEINIKDVQFVFGRHGSVCDAPHPPQPPVTKK